MSDIPRTAKAVEQFRRRLKGGTVTSQRIKEALAIILDSHIELERELNEAKRELDELRKDKGAAELRGIKTKTPH